MSASKGVLEITKRELIPDETSIYKINDGTIFYYKTRDPKKLYVKQQGKEIVADLQHNYNTYDYFGAHEDGVYFCSLTVGKILKASFIYVTDIWIFEERDVCVGEMFHAGALCSLVLDGITFVYRMCDGPLSDIRLDYPAKELQAMRLAAIIKGTAVFVVEEAQLQHPVARRLCPNGIVIVVSALKVESGAAIGGDPSGSLYIAHSNTFFYFYTENMHFLAPLRMNGGRITSIAGSMDEDGAFTVICSDQGQSFLASAKLPDDYFNNPVQMQEMQNTIDRLGRFIKKASAETDTTSDRLMDTIKRLGQKFDLSEYFDSDEEREPTRQSMPSNAPAFRGGSANNDFDSKFAREFSVTAIRGVGGFGCVFEVYNKLDNWVYAVKRVGVDASDMEKALREVRAMAQLDHSGIVRYNGSWIEQPPEGWQFDADAALLKHLELPRNHLNFKHHRDDSVFLYIQMQLCNYSLSDWLRENQEPSARDFRRMKSWFKQMISAVDYIHNNNIIHRDLKPSNILFLEADVLKLCDLGIATQRREEDQFESLKSRTDVGTKLYMSPEQLANRRYSSQTDVFTLGLIFTELLVVMKPLLRTQIFDNYRRGIANYLIEDAQTARFIRTLTQTEAEYRPTCREMLDSLFLA